ncbi:hypothetical protein [Demequina sediminicola]|uniref:hypothetical protein n=1 Tax=Demequina sediminicola TaxID=1095026 RepID=UPI000785A256|nr:hypothetical protein [Demequina sediminicola]
MALTSQVARWTAALTGIVLITGCSWRLESSTPTYPSPDAVTIMRDDAADREDAVLASASTPDAEANSPVLAWQEAATTPERIEALGGVYEAYPEASPSPSTSITPGVPLLDVVENARDGHLADALQASDPDLAFLLASGGLSHSLLVWYSTWVDAALAGGELPVAAERLPGSSALEAETLVPTAPALEAATISALALTHDQSAYLYEVLAAKSEGDERDLWLARRDMHRERASALIALPSVTDERQAVYVSPTADMASPQARTALAQQQEVSLGQTYAALLNGADHDDLAWLISSAFDAYAQAAAYAETPDDESSVEAWLAEAPLAPALPGASVSHVSTP